MLRWGSPIGSFMRTATRDTELRGTPIREGDRLLMLYASANRDEAVFGPDAEEFRTSRDASGHVAFGYGEHFCLGAALARMEGRIAFEELLGRFGGRRAGRSASSASGRSASAASCISRWRCGRSGE